MSETTVNPRKYEGLFLFGTASTVKVDDAQALVRGFLEKHGATVHVLRKWDDRRLAYEVKKESRGLYLLSFFEAPPSAVDHVNREVNLNDTVLRCLITDADHLSAAEVEAMQPQKPAPRKTREDEEGYSGPRPPVADRTDDFDPSAADGLEDDQVDAEVDKAE
jgi:small subunit ribosomal protein S6